MDTRLAAVTAAHGGPFRVGDALRAGYGRGRVRGLLASGEWTRLRRGVCVETSLLEACDPVRRHALYVAAALLVLGGETVCSHESAAVLSGIALLDRPDHEVTLTRPPGSPRRERTSGARIHIARMSPGHVERRFGVPVTTAGRTVVDLACWSSFEAGAVAADSAMRGRTLDHAELAKVIGECAGRPGLTRAARVLEVATPRARSPLETLGRLMCADAGLPAPEVSVLMGDEREIRTEVDLYWREHRVVVLFDGMFKYDDPWTNRKEKLVQEWLEHAGLVVVRLTWGDVTRHRARSVERVRAAFGRARRLSA